MSDNHSIISSTNTTATSSTSVAAASGDVAAVAVTAVPLSMVHQWERCLLFGIDQAKVTCQSLREHTSSLPSSSSSSTTEFFDLVNAVLHGRLASILASPVGARVFSVMNISSDASLSSETKSNATIPVTSSTNFVTAIQLECKRILADESIIPFDVRQFHVLVLGVAALNLFVQANWTGLPPSSSPLCSPSSVSILDKQCTSLLRLDGEDVYSYARYPHLLLAARAIFSLEPTLLSSCQSLPWWFLRYASIHQQMLFHNAGSLKTQVDATLPQMSLYTTMTPSASISDRMLAARAHLEIARTYQTYWDYKKMESSLEAARTCTGVFIELTGAMGMRTRHQREEKALSIVHAHSMEDMLLATTYEGQSLRALNEIATTSNNQAQIVAAAAREAALASASLIAGAITTPITDATTSTGSAATTTSVSSTLSTPETRAPGVPLTIGALADAGRYRVDPLPRNIPLNSDVLLPEAKLSEPVEPTRLLAIDHVMILSTCDQIRATRSGGELTKLDLNPYIERLLAHDSIQHSWAAYCYTLYQRSLLEGKESYKSERAILQLEELVQSLDPKHLDPEARDALAAWRMSELFTVALPSVWNMRKALADVYVILGMHKAALDLYEAIQLWDSIVECLIRLGRKTRAEEMLLERMAIEPEPKLLCLLGDIRHDEKQYEAAWELSKGTYPRAKRALGKFHLDAKNWAEAIASYTAALEINPIFPFEWFAVGFCGLEIKDYAVAANAFSRVVALDPEYGDAWNNLAAAHLHLKQKKQAFLALEEASKHKHDSWRMWENYLATAMDIGEVQKAMLAMERIVELKGANDVREDKTGKVQGNVDEEALKAITDFVLKEFATTPDTFVVTRYQSMMTRIAERASNNPVFWSCFAQFNGALSLHAQAVECREKQCKTLEQKGWADSIDTMTAVVDGYTLLVDAYVSRATSSNLRSGRLYVESVIAKAKKSPLNESSDADTVTKYSALMGRLTSLLDRLTSTSSAPAKAASSTPSELSDMFALYR